MNYRSLFAGINEPVRNDIGKYITPINFDNAATTPPFKCVVDYINQNIKNYSSIGRGSGQKAEYCTELFEHARDDILNFFHAKENHQHSVIYVKSTTEGLNLLADVLNYPTKQSVLITRMEHHANDLPWRCNTNVDYVDVDCNGRIAIEEIEKKLKEHNGKIRYVTITGASNVTGYMNDLNKIAVICHKYNAQIIVDAAQAAAHCPINIAGSCPEEQLDFLVFSAHKAYAPFGGGAIIGLTDVLQHVEPFLKGGGIVEHVFDYYTLWDDIPPRLEAGTQNFFGIIAMAEALRKIQQIGFDAIMEHEILLKEKLFKEMCSMKNVIVYGDTYNISDRIGIIPFNIADRNYEEVCDILTEHYAIALRCGKFCAHPYADRLLGINDKSIAWRTEHDTGLIRASLGLYNTMDEVNYFLNALDLVRK